MKKQTFAFLCSDASGNEFSIVEFTEFYAVGLSNVLDEKNAVPGLKEYRTSDGLPCNRLDEDHFLIFPDQIKVTVKK